MFKEIDSEKMREFVLDAVEGGGLRIACPRRGMVLRTMRKSRCRAPPWARDGETHCYDYIEGENEKNR